MGCASIDGKPSDCDLESLAPVFENPTAFVGKKFCGEVSVFTIDQIHMTTAFTHGPDPSKFEVLITTDNLKKFFFPENTFGARYAIVGKINIDGVEACHRYIGAPAPKCVPHKRPVFLTVKSIKPL